MLKRNPYQARKGQSYYEKIFTDLEWEKTSGLKFYYNDDGIFD